MKLVKLYFPVLFIVIIDQLSKNWIKTNFILWESREILGSFLKFSYVNNPGIAFGISVGDWVVLITVLSIFATFFIGYIHWQEQNEHMLIFLAFSFILGGAIGNLIDRSSVFFVENYVGVVDFIDIGLGMNRWYTFNIADSAVTVGIVLYLIHSLSFQEKNDLSNETG